MKTISRIKGRQPAAVLGAARSCAHHSVAGDSALISLIAGLTHDAKTERLKDSKTVFAVLRFNF